jgi:outer membrane protein TolC
LTLEQVLADVRANHPEIRSAVMSAGADRERIAQATSWEDPVVGLELQRMNNRDLFSYDAAELQLSQTIPLPGNLSRKKAAAEAEVNVSEAVVRSRAFRLTADARDAFFQLLKAREQRALLEQMDRLLVQAADFVRTQLASGANNTAALLMAERERAELRERALMLDREVADATAALNTLRNLPPQQPIGDLASPAGLPALPSLDTVEEHAQAHRPELAEAIARVRAAERAQDLAARAWRPDPAVMVKARHLDGAGRAVNDFDTGIAVSIPWANGKKYRSAEREAAKRRQAAELDVAAMRTKTAGEVREMWQRADTAQRNVELFSQQLVPLAQQTADATREGVITGKNSLFELISAERALVDAKTSLAANRADLRRYQAMLLTLAGMEDGL